MNRPACAVALLLLSASMAHAQSRFMVERYTIGGEGGWDYLSVEPAGNRLFVSRGTHVQVFDLSQHKLIGDITNTMGVHGIVVVPEFRRGFTTNGRDSTLTVFDATSLTPLSSIQIPSRNPDAILYEPHTKRIFAMNHTGQSVTAVDAKTGAVIGTTPIGGVAEAAVSDEHHVYINIEDKGAIVKVDAKTLKLDATWPIAPCEEPTGLAFDEKHDRLFAACGGNKMMAVVNSDNGKLITTVPIGAGSDGIVFDPETKLIYTSNGEGSVTVIHEDSPDKYSVVATIPTQRGARTITLDPRTHTVYLSAALYGEAPAPTAAQPRPRPPIVPGSFMIVAIRRK
ncbi:MAG TPA: YncE family protein [Longimicrobiales bacterium]|nr:YncE family protein [Longimicrobiales bacterium]